MKGGQDDEARIKDRDSPGGPLDLQAVCVRVVSLVILGSMKTAVSVPDELFQAGERAADRLGLSRSGLYSKALQEYLARHDDEEITRRLDEVYAHEPSALDPAMSRLAARSLPKESWK